MDSPHIKTYGESFVNILHAHFGVSKVAKTLGGVERMKEPIVSDETMIEWKETRWVEVKAYFAFVTHD